jgi:hypothetical protein
MAPTARRPAPAPRYPLANLAHAAGAKDLSDLARRLGITLRHAHRLHSEGLSDRQADHFAIRLRMHPATVWPDWERNALDAIRAARRRDSHGRWAS